MKARDGNKVVELNSPTRFPARPGSQHKSSSDSLVCLSCPRSPHADGYTTDREKKKKKKKKEKHPDVNTIRGDVANSHSSLLS